MPAKSSRGRKGSFESSRNLIALMSGLENSDREITVQSVETALGVSQDEAAKLLDMLFVLSVDGTPLPFEITDDGQGIRLAVGSAARGSAVRLTTQETRAILAALRRAGLDETNEMFQTVETSYIASGADPAEALHALGGSNAANIPDLEECVQAFLDRDNKSLKFIYRAADGQTSERQVAPELVYFNEGLWYLDAYDFDRGATRTFRLDRMSDVRVSGKREDVVSLQPDEPRMVDLVFHDISYAELFSWPNLEFTRGEGKERKARLPYYGGDWLVRRLVACGVAVEPLDDELRLQVADYARKLFAELS